MPGGPAMLVVGHPGHELRVHGWLEHARPVVMVLTDGSGCSGVSRLSSTVNVLERVGATPGEVFGALTDAALYRALLDRHTSVFTDLAARIATAIIRHDIEVVAGDDAEGFNPAHDVCRLVVDAAVRLARSATGRPVANLAFALMEAPSAVPRHLDDWSSTLVLTDAALERKLRAALSYPEMAAEVAAARARWSDEAFQIEAFRHVAENESWSPGDEQPFYEQYGRQRVKDGVYSEVIQYDLHMSPIIAALAASALRQAS
jgi:hypothetical protein